ncbi:Ig-like domain-containing protein [Alcanivorax sp. 24]|uniref:Ig-like domain-containing protein n=1 Tax=Alcanivorax sp. 24 TaxID=2545266 RepID=UPI001060FB6F|nr:Ig-like domain-containing protein [Alcanivorax sp. 24]
MIRGTFNRTLYGTLLITACATVLTACGGSDGSDMPGNDANDAQRQSLLYAYPDDGQSEVAIPAPVVLRFSSDIELAAAENNIKLRLGGADGDIVPVTYSKVEADGRSILLTPTEKLQPLTDYTVTLRGVQLSVGKAPNRDIHFTTRALQRGPKSLVVADDDFTLARAIPSGDTEEPVMDFSTFRFQFTQPIDPTSARYGLNPGDGTTPADTVALVDGSGELVEARLLTEGPYMTLDPTPEHLTPGETYTLTLGDGLASTFGNTFGGHEFTVTPQDSSPRGEPAILVQRITDSENRTRTSPLTGKPVNEVPVNATLLGQDNVTQASGDVRAELGDVTVYPDVTPVRIPAETILSGTSLEVLIGGEVPAGFASGEVKMHFLSDATGYLVPNPYDTHNRADALRIVRLFMDVAITTDEARANGGFTQDMLHIELIGVGEVDPQEGVLKIDAVSVVEPDVLGQEFAHGMLSFQLESYKDQLNAPAPVPDTAPLEFQSWTLGIDEQTGLDKTAMFKPTDPIVLNFTRPLDRQTVTGKVHLYKNEGGVQTEVDSKVTVDGAAIVIKPVEPLEHPTETGPSLSYQVSLDPGIMDLRGEPWVGFLEGGNFELPLISENRQEYSISLAGTLLPKGDIQAVTEKSPFLLGVYPGFPCAVHEEQLNLSEGTMGRCRGGIQPHAVPTDKLAYALEPDDVIPIPKMPANRPIIVVTSSSLDAETVIPEKTFIVIEHNPDGSIKKTVKGQLILKGDTIKFTPNSPWKEGTLYSYTLKSNGNTQSSSGCDSTGDNETICSKKGLPLNTQILTESEVHYEARNGFYQDSYATPQWIFQTKGVELYGGGPDFKQYFFGAKRSDNVLQLMRITHNYDTNKNLIFEKNLSDFSSISGPGVSDPIAPNIGLSRLGEDHYFMYEFDEASEHEFEADHFTSDLEDYYGRGIPLDPEGVRPPPNTAKVLSSQFGITSIEQGRHLAFTGEGLIWPRSKITAGYIGANIGCGFEEFSEWDNQDGGCENSPPQTYGDFIFQPGQPIRYACFKAKPRSCPEDKFTIIHGALFAEVTNQVVPGKGLLVNILPGQMVTTSFKVYTKNMTGRAQDTLDSGYQVMRMRYDNGGPIKAYIEEDNGVPQLKVDTVNLYLNAPQLVAQFKRQRIASSDYAFHNLYSYPVTMALSGRIDFLSDGRMQAKQTNIGSLDVPMRGNSPATWVDLVIPHNGVNLDYISEPIK